MKFVEAVCKECKTEFKVTFKESILPLLISCPICGGDVKYIKIDSNGKE